MKSDSIKNSIAYYALRHGEFTLSSGAKSNLYFDMRAIPFSSRFWREVARRVIGKIECADARTCAYVAGVDYGGVPVAFAIGMLAKGPRPLVVRSKNEAIGVYGLGDGSLDGRRVTIVDDVASTGGSIIRAACELRRRGAVVERAAVIVERPLGARHKLDRARIDLRALYQESDFAFRNDT